MNENIENVGLINIEFNDLYNSIILNLRKIDMPYEQFQLICKNVQALSVCRKPNSKAPFFLLEISWKELDEHENPTALQGMPHPFYRDGTFSKMVAVYLSGYIEGAIITEYVEIVQGEKKMGQVPPLPSST